MPARFSQTGQPDDLFRRIRARLSAGRYRRQIVSAVILPKSAACFDGRLQMQLPADFRVRSYKKDKAVFVGQRSGLRLTVMRMPFSVPLSRLTAADLCGAMSGVLPEAVGLPELRRGLLHRFHTLTARWDSAVLYLIRVRGVLYLLLMTGITPQNADAVMPVLRAVGLRPDVNRKTV